MTSISGPEPTTTTRWVPAGELRTLGRQVLVGSGMRPSEAAATAGALVDADLRGIDTHGVSLLPLYARQLSASAITPRPDIRTVHAQGTVATVDAGFGLGHAPTLRATALAAELAGEFGTGVVGVVNSGHYGAAGFYVRKLADVGLVGFTTTNATPLMPAPGGTVPLVSNSPFALAAPRAHGPHLVVDMACSVAALAKVRRAAQNDERVPSGWGFGPDGRPTDDPRAILERNLLAPIGGYKGFNLALAFEVLAAGLCGAALGQRAGSMGQPGSRGCGHIVLAMDPAAFGTVGFEAAVAAWLDELRAAAPDLRIPGVAGEQCREQRLASGIPVARGLLERLRALTQTPPMPS